MANKYKLSTTIITGMVDEEVMPLCLHSLCVCLIFFYILYIFIGFPPPGIGEAERTWNSLQPTGDHQ